MTRYLEVGTEIAQRVRSGNLPPGALLPAVRVCARERDTTASTINQLLTAAGVAPDDLAGPELGSHLEIALAVASGITDVGLGVRTVANELDLDFISLVWECYDIALAGDGLGAARPLITALRDPVVQASILNLGGYDLGLAGTIEPLTQASA